jgi:hypothetical protein
MRVCPRNAMAGKPFDDAPNLWLLQRNITGAYEMIRLTIALVGALLLAACTDVTSPPQPQAASAESGAGHPSPSYPGPRAY